MGGARWGPRPVQAAYRSGSAVAERSARSPSRRATPMPGTCPSWRAMSLPTNEQICASTANEPTVIPPKCAAPSTWASHGRRRVSRREFGGLANYVRPGVLSGTEHEVIDRIGAYVTAGAEQVNLALRAPFDADELERFAAALELHVAAPRAGFEGGRPTSTMLFASLLSP